MRPYPAYKDSGVEWLGEVPEGWEAPKLKRFARLVYGDALASEVREADGEVLVYGSNGPVGRHNVSNTRSPAILIGRKGSYGALNWADTPCFAIDTVYFIDPASAMCELRWLYWALHTANLDAISQDTGVPGLSRDDAHATHIPLPPLPEQKAIARFLDGEVAKIDALVAEQRRLIVLLAEKRQAVISHAVTKGLNPATPLKPSGIDWLGDIPEGWEVVRVKAIAKLAGRIGYRGYTTADIVEEGEGAITLSPSNIREGAISFQQSTYISWAKYEESPEIKLASQDVIMVKTGSTFGKVGYVAEVDIPPATINPQLVIFKEIGCLPEYLFLSLSADHTRSYIAVSNTGSSIPTMTQEAIGGFAVALPLREEQHRIVDFVREVSAQLDALTTAAQSAISLLQERRAALISAAVTGKIDLRPHFAQSLSEPEIA